MHTAICKARQELDTMVLGFYHLHRLKLASVLPIARDITSLRYLWNAENTGSHRQGLKLGFLSDKGSPKLARTVPCCFSHVVESSEVISQDKGFLLGPCSANPAELMIQLVMLSGFENQGQKTLAWQNFKSQIYQQNNSPLSSPS